LSDFVDRKPEWETAIGRALLAFGSIEHATIVCLTSIPRDKIQRSTMRFNLAPRIDLLLEILEGHTGEAFTQLSDALKRARQLAETRNLIAHNPLVFEFYEHEDGGYTINDVIASLHKQGKTLSLDELKDFASQSTLLASDLYTKTSNAIAALEPESKA
jgi:hypothetical protein